MAGDSGELWNLGLRTQEGRGFKSLERAGAAATTGTGTWVTESGGSRGRAPTSLRSSSLTSAWVSMLEVSWQGSSGVCPMTQPTQGRSEGKREGL